MFQRPRVPRVCTVISEELCWPARSPTAEISRYLWRAITHPFRDQNQNQESHPASCSTQAARIAEAELEASTRRRHPPKKGSLLSLKVSAKGAVLGLWRRPLPRDPSIAGPVAATSPPACRRSSTSSGRTRPASPAKTSHASPRRGRLAARPAARARRHESGGRDRGSTGFITRAWLACGPAPAFPICNRRGSNSSARERLHRLSASLANSCVAKPTARHRLRLIVRNPKFPIPNPPFHEPPRPRECSSACTSPSGE